MTKTIKISDWVHRELRTFLMQEWVVGEKESITSFADTSIISMLQTKGYKVRPPKKSKQHQ